MQYMQHVSERGGCPIPMDAWTMRRSATHRRSAPSSNAEDLRASS
jgi:hypothetical protein